jgi:hypothetical protein
MRDGEQNEEWNREAGDDGTDHDFLSERRLRLSHPLLDRSEISHFTFHMNIA